MSNDPKDLSRKAVIAFASSFSANPPSETSFPATDEGRDAYAAACSQHRTLAAGLDDFAAALGCPDPSMQLLTEPERTYWLGIRAAADRLVASYAQLEADRQERHRLGINDVQAWRDEQEATAPTREKQRQYNEMYRTRHPGRERLRRLKAQLPRQLKVLDELTAKVARYDAGKARLDEITAGSPQRHDHERLDLQIDTNVYIGPVRERLGKARRAVEKTKADLAEVDRELRAQGAGAVSGSSTGDC